MYELPSLSFDYGALEPHISGRLMELHHSKHHAAYVKGANETLEKLEAARDSNDFAMLGQLEKSLAFNLSGHVLHTRLWECLSPTGGGDPPTELAGAISATFGSVDALRAQMTAAVTSIQGSGWAAMSWEPLAGRLIVQQVYDHQSNVSQGSAPLLVIDAWEHAFYLDYLNDKAAWAAAFWKVVNWPSVAERFDRERAASVAAHT